MNKKINKKSTKKKKMDSKKLFKVLKPLDAIHQMAKGLYDASIIDSITMREFDALCLPKIKEFKPLQIKKIRLREKLSQTVFAAYLNTSPSTIRQWETGNKHPNGPSLKLLNLVHDKGINVLV